MSKCQLCHTEQLDHHHIVPWMVFGNFRNELIGNCLPLIKWKSNSIHELLTSHCCDWLELSIQSAHTFNFQYWPTRFSSCALVAMTFTLIRNFSTSNYSCMVKKESIRRHFTHTRRTAHTERIGHHKSLEWNVFSVELNVCMCKCVFVQAIYSSFVFFVSSTLFTKTICKQIKSYYWFVGVVDGRSCECSRITAIKCNSL